MARYRDVQVCQQCGRKFLGRKALLCHMNHPFGTCYNHVQEVANLFEDLQSYSGLKHQSQRPSPLSSDDGNNTVQPTNQEPMDVDLDPLISYDDGPFFEEYEGAAKEYGAGVTFMSEFDRDQHAAERVANLYYPFASKDEWKVAAFLLRSNLSMASIDSFLSLKLVSAHHSYWHCHLSNFRGGYGLKSII